ncbi:Uncharacterized protein DAT39_005043, partial [Clarias magur]
MRLPQVSLEDTFNQQTSAGVGKPRLSLENKNQPHPSPFNPDRDFRERTVGEDVKEL